MSPVRRIIVGVSGRPGNLPALRRAADLAHATGGVLVPVHAWAPTGLEVAAHEFPGEELHRVWEDAAWQRLWDALGLAFGGIPSGIPIMPVVAPGRPGPILVRAAGRADDLLVVGAGRRRGGVHRLWHGTVSRHCLAHACCPVLAVPPPVLQAAATLLPNPEGYART